MVDDIHRLMISRYGGGRMNTVDVAVVGAGPTGLMLACELAMRGVRVRVLEERGDLPNITRAFGLHARTLELLDARDMADEIGGRGVPVREVAPAPGATLNLRELPTRYPMVLIAPQSLTERVLSARASQLGVDIAHGQKVVGLEQDHEGVTLRLADGVVLLVPFGDGWFRAIAWDRTREQAPLSERVSLAEIRAAFLRIAHTDFGMADMRWSSRFLSERRQAKRYRAGRVFIAGDAAHVHSPLGAQGMNTGIQDAMNLGWKLAQAVGGFAPPWVLDSYEEERHTVGANVLKLTDGFNQLVLGRSLLRRALRRVVITVLLNVPATRHMLEGRLSGIGIRYPRPRGAHPLTGRRMPDIDCSGTRLYELMRDGRFTVVTSDKVDIGRSDVTFVVHVDPRLPAAVLVRPDGYVAWAGERAELAAMVGHWCGERQPSTNPTY